MTHSPPQLLADPLNRFRGLYEALNADRGWFGDVSSLRFAAMTAVACQGSPVQVAAAIRSMAEIEDRKEQIASAVWWVLSRPPTPEELRILGEYVAEHTESDGTPVEDAFQQVVWALTTSAEFRFNH